jgi:hypothetical protein|tara:strand:+ start:1532 stop:1783 length:252 start_codon:yes stop_codon:yes gene_type:complete
MKKPELWKCSDCGRSFKHPNQWHSCSTQSLEDHFVDMSLEVKQFFNYMVELLKKEITLTLTPLKSEIDSQLLSWIKDAFILTG